MTRPHPLLGPLLGQTPPMAIRARLVQPLGSMRAEFADEPKRQRPTAAENPAYNNVNVPDRIEQALMPGSASITELLHELECSLTHLKHTLRKMTADGRIVGVGKPRSRLYRYRLSHWRRAVLLTIAKKAKP